jgi:hypothetical protein
MSDGRHRGLVRPRRKSRSATRARLAPYRAACLLVSRPVHYSVSPPVGRTGDDAGRAVAGGPDAAGRSAATVRPLSARASPWR